MNFILFIFFVLFSVSTVSPELTHGQFYSSPKNIPWFFLSGHPGAQNLTSFGKLISVIIPNIIVFAGVFFLILLIFAGYQLIIYGGQYNSPQRVAKAKNMITYAFVGFLIVVSGYFILQIIGTVLGINFFNSPVN